MQVQKSGVSLLPRLDLAAETSSGYHLRYTSRLASQLQATVKFHGVFTSHWETLAFAPGRVFRGLHLGTAMISLRHSCGSSFKRQGISLP